MITIKKGEDFPFDAPIGEIAYVEALDTYFKLDRTGWHEIAAQVWVNGAKKTQTKAVFASAEVPANGQTVFNLADASGNAILSEVFSGGVIVLPNNKNISFGWDVGSIAEDKKSLTLNVRKLSLELGLLSLSTVPVGETISIIVYGK